jgi:hypothetical protein
MDIRKEVILQDAKLENVLRYLYNKLKEVSFTNIEWTYDNGTIHRYCIQNVFPSNTNKIEVRYTTVIEPRGDPEKAYGFWGDFIAMSFEGLQLQNNTVKIMAEFENPFFKSVFIHYWDDMLKDFGAVQVEAVKPEQHPKPKGKRGETLKKENKIIAEYEKQLKRKAKDFRDALYRDKAPKVRVTAKEVYDAIGDKIGVKIRYIQKVLKDHKRK